MKSQRKQFRKAHLGDEIYGANYSEIKREKDRLFFHRELYHGKRFLVFIKNNPYIDYKYVCLVYEISTRQFIEKHKEISLSDAHQAALYWIADDRSVQFNYDGDFFRIQRTRY